jgi:hypothetical protein
MPFITKSAATWNRAGRRHKFKGAAARTNIYGPFPFPYPSDMTYPDWAAPEMKWGPNNELSGQFLFWSVTGSATGSWISTDPTLSLPVGSENATATAWYAPLGIGPGGPGMFIDAFDVTSDEWLDGDFVSVTSDPSLSAAANSDGVVPLAKAQDVLAFPSCGGEPFTEWVVIAENAAVNGQELHASAGTSVMAFATFKMPVPTVVPTAVIPYYAIGTWVDFGVTVGGGGRTGLGRVGPRTPSIPLELVAGIALGEIADVVYGELAGEVRRLASEQVRIAGGKIAQKIAENGD